ncbi:MAG: hypothetical protein RML95_08455 [Anaerolineae bacterium]|nr:hypothetical protein [Anaerolineae bacterium]MDW8299357.1 hypothetical protein [Anaerolineae bacterium]
MVRKLVLMVFVIGLAAVAFGGVEQVRAQSGKERITIEVEPRMRAQDLIRELRAKELIPSGGSQQMSVPRTVINVRNQGFWYFPLGRGTQLSDFVLHFELRAQELPSETNGCGMVFRAIDDDNFSYVMLTKDRRIVLVQLDRGEEIVAFDQSIDDLEGLDATNYELDETQLHIITLIAYGNELTLFLNGVEITYETTARSVRGRFATMLFNEEGNPSNTECRYSNVFAWNLP